MYLFISPAQETDSVFLKINKNSKMQTLNIIQTFKNEMLTNIFYAFNPILLTRDFNVIKMTLDNHNICVYFCV